MGLLISDIHPTRIENAAVAAAFETEPTSSGTKYILPYRDLSEVASFGWLIVVMGVLGIVFMISWIWGPAAAGLAMVRNGNVFGAALLLFASAGLIGMFVAAKMFAAGLTIIRNRSRCEVEIRGQRLYSIEILGWFQWQRKFDIRMIQRLELQRAKEPGEKKKPGPSAFPWFDNLYAINAVAKDSSFIVAPGYEKKLIETLAEDLSREMAKEVSLAASAKAFENEPTHAAGSNIISDRDQPSMMPVVDKTTMDDLEDAKQLEKPADSKIEKVVAGHSTAFQVPPQGFRKGTYGLFGFSVFWLVFVGFFVLVALFAGKGPAKGDAWIVFSMLGLFALVGIVMLLASINMARRSVMIGIADDQLFIERKTIFGTKWIELPLAEIMDIRVGPSGTEVNDVPIMELQILTYRGKKHGLLSQLSEEEKCWLASELSSALSLGGTRKRAVEYNATRDPNWPNPPADCDTRLESMTRTELRIIVPPLGFAKGWVGSLIGSVIIAGAVTGIVLAKPDPGTMGFILFFALIGALILVASIVYCCRRYEFHATRDHLTVTRTGLLGRKIFQWSARDIARIQMSTVGQTNGKPVMQLSILGNEKALLNSMYSRSPQEILYVAAHLNQVLGQDQPHLVATDAIAAE